MTVPIADEEIEDSRAEQFFRVDLGRPFEMQFPEIAGRDDLGRVHEPRTTLARGLRVEIDRSRMSAEGLAEFSECRIVRHVDEDGIRVRDPRGLGKPGRDDESRGIRCGSLILHDLRRDGISP